MEDAKTFESVPTQFSAILNAVNLEMIERPALLDPAVVPEEWEVTTITCRLSGKERKLKVMYFCTYALHVQEVQGVPF